MNESLENLLNALDTALAKKGVGGDAIDRTLAGGGRSTQVTSLRDSEVVRKFQDELVDGLIRVDTAGQLLDLVTTVVTSSTKSGASTPVTRAIMDCATPPSMRNVCCSSARSTALRPSANPDRDRSYP